MELLAVIPHSGIVLGHYFLKIRLRQELLFWDSAEDGVKIWACLGLICFCPICFQSNWDIFPLWILTISILWDIFLFQLFLVYRTFSFIGHFPCSPQNNFSSQNFNVENNYFWIDRYFLQFEFLENKQKILILSSDTSRKYFWKDSVYE